MSDRSSIEWTEATWNPVTGCTKVSPGCDHCYAETFAERWRGTPGHHFEHGFDVTLLGRELGAGPKGGDWSAWPAALRVREFPAAAGKAA